MKMRFVFDPNRCVGCHACVLACASRSRDSEVLKNQHLRNIRTFNPNRHPLLRVQHLSLSCNHCEDAACLRNCPASAYIRDKDTGAVIHHPERCMGCRYCTWACPFDAPKYSEETGLIEKCDFCLDRQKAGQEPACVAHCPLGALSIEVMPLEAAAGQDEKATDGQGVELPPAFPETRLKPSVRFIALRREAPPDMKVEGGRLARFLDPLLQTPSSRVSLAGEWPLALFTQVIALLSAWLLASMLGGARLHWAVFAGVGAVAMALSTWHLGNKSNAWRACMNVFRSWLSREIFLVGAFLALGTWHLISGQALYGWIAAGVAFAALIAIDKIYCVARPLCHGRLHSAQALLSAAFLLGLLAGMPVLAWSMGSLKFLLYLHRKLMKREGFLMWLLGLARVFFGFASPILFRARPVLAVSCVLLGELLDRLEFYMELEFDSPDRDLALRMSRIFMPRES